MHCHFLLFQVQRLKAILGMFDKTIYPEHVLLVADMMTNAGKVVGLTHSGLRDFINAIHVSAPMTHGLFKVIFDAQLSSFRQHFSGCDISKISISVAESSKAYPGCSCAREM